MIIISFVFIYGVAVGAKNIFPYKEIIYIKTILFGGKSIFNVSEKTSYYYRKKSQFEILSNYNNANIVMIGDSMTDEALWGELINRVDIINRGIGTDTTDGLLSRIDNLNPNLDKAFIMIGINDFLRQDKSVEDVFINYKKIIENIKNQNITPYIQSTLYTGDHLAKKYNKKVKELNSLLLEYADLNKIVFIDLNKVLSSNKKLSNEYSFDGLHLNGKGYMIWAKTIKKYF